MTLNPALQKLVSKAAMKYCANDDDDCNTDHDAFEDEKVVDRAMAREGRKLFRRAHRLEMEAEALRLAAKPVNSKRGRDHSAPFVMGGSLRTPNIAGIHHHPGP